MLQNGVSMKGKIGVLLPKVTIKDSTLKKKLSNLSHHAIQQQSKKPQTSKNPWSDACHENICCESAGHERHHPDLIHWL